MKPPRGWARESDRRGAGPRNPSGAGPRETAEGLGATIRVGHGPVRGAGPQNPSGAGPRVTAEGVGPRSRLGQGPERPPRGWAPEPEWRWAP